MSASILFRSGSVLLLAACGPRNGDPSGERELTFGAYSTPREAYGQAILPAFAEKWGENHGEDVSFRESYQGSGAQARAVIEGFEADVVALSLEPDVDAIAEAGLISHDWRASPTHGMVTTSLVVIAVRPGNPKGIRDWADLAAPGIQVLTPNVRTSGGAQWNMAAIYGAALRGHVAGVPAADPDAAQQLLAKILRNVPVMDKGARESMLAFESGVGDAALTYENEVLVAQQAGQKLDYVVPASTIVIENPVAVVDGYAAHHGNDDLASGLVDFLVSPEAQAAFARYGLRPVVGDPPAGWPIVADAFRVGDLGGWAALEADLFARDALYDRALAAAQRP